MTEKFWEYEEFIWLNTHMSREEAHRMAVWCWEHDLNKYDALKKARREHEED